MGGAQLGDAGFGAGTLGGEVGGEFAVFDLELRGGGAGGGDLGHELGRLDLACAEAFGEGGEPALKE